MKFRYDLIWASDTCDIINERLKDEEKKSKAMLDKKIDAKHTMEDTKEDYTIMFTKKVDHRQEMINKQVLLSKLRQQNKRLVKEDAELEKQNTHLIKENEQNNKINDEYKDAIFDLVKRIDVSTLLKEIDVEEMKLMAKNNIMM